MVFSSIPFLYYFLPCVLLVYFAAPPKGKNIVLLMASLIFYAWGEPVYLLLLMALLALTFAAGTLLENGREKGRESMTQKWMLTAFVCLLVTVLGYFKYADFLIASWNAATQASCPLLHIALPIGISFYTFQMISYLADVYRGEMPAQRNLISLALYIAMFPQLIAGPIVRYKDIARQLDERHCTWQMLERGSSRFVIGLSKKVLLANELGALCQIFRSSEEKSVLFYWIYAAALCLQIYLDFSAYSDMAIGLGSLFGFSLPENFQYPYISKSITEFWRRWHISLGTWFRDYVYIPLGGSRTKKWKWYRNILIVWLLTGLWHGAAWNFIVWGICFGILLVIEKSWLLERLEKLGRFSHIYVLFVVMLSFVIFNAVDMQQAIADIRCLLGMGGLPLVTAEAAYYLKSYGVTLLIGALASTPIPKRLWEKKRGDLWAVKMGGLLLLLLLCTALLADGSFNPFLYFRF